jgi:hypothetical protein
MKAEATRRQVLAGGSLAAGAAVLGGCGETPIPGTLDGADWQRGHLLRDHKFPDPTGPIEDISIVIAGGGVAGLAAGWRLAEARYSSFRLFELEDTAGGNARSGSNAVHAEAIRHDCGRR